jgi:hypothetical protein
MVPSTKRANLGGDSESFHLENAAAKPSRSKSADDGAQEEKPICSGLRT